MVDATANDAKFKAHNGQYIQVNAGTEIRVQTVPGTYVDVETYEDKDILDVSTIQSAARPPPHLLPPGRLPRQPPHG